MDGNHLSPWELNFELLSRKIKPKSTLTSRRIQFSIAITEKKVQSMNPFDWDTNYSQLQESLAVIESNLDKVLNTDLILKIETQITHVKNRIQLTDSKNNPDRQVRLKTLSINTDAFEKLLLEKEQALLQESQIETPISSPTVSYREKFVAVHKWNFEKFKGHNDSRDILTFLVEINDLKKARGGNDESLFNAVTDLFHPDAINFCRNAKAKTTNWNDFVKLLKNEYLPSDYGLQLEKQFQNSIQGKENIFTYLTDVETLSKKLERHVSEEELMGVVVRGLEPYYATILVLNKFTSLEQLKNHCKLIHELKLRNATYRANVKSVEVATGQLAQLDLEVERRGALPVNTSPSTAAPAASGNFLCWNCNKTGHRYPSCPEKRKVFCYQCGLPNSFSGSCQRCLERSKNERGNQSPVSPGHANPNSPDPPSTRLTSVRSSTPRGRGRGRGALTRMSSPN